MKYIIKENKEFLLAFFGTLFLILSCSVFVSNANTEVQELVIKSMTPIYDEESTVSVDNTNVIFNDKNQVVKYNVLVENTQSYDVKIIDIKFTTPTEEFLKYTVENVELDDVIKANETKELVVSFETVKMDGWGRNFNDELVTTIVFDKVVATEEVIPPIDEPSEDEPEVPEVNEPSVEQPEQPTDGESDVTIEQPKEEIPDTNENNNVEIDNNNQPENNEVTNNTPPVEEPKEEVKEDVSEELVPSPEISDINKEIGVEEVVKNDNADLVVIFAFGIATGVLGIGLIMVNKNKFAKYIVVFVILGSSLKIGFADEVIDLEIPVNVSYESQNVMKPSGCTLYHDDNGDAHIDCKQDFWKYNKQIANIYIENELNELEEYVHRFDVSNDGKGRVIAYLVELEKLGNSCVDWDNNPAKCYDLYLQADGIIYSNVDASYYFADMYYLEKLENLDGFDTSNVTNMKRMFFRAGYNSKTFALDLTSFDTSNVTTMCGMFNEAGLKSETFTLDVSSFDTSKVAHMDHMFNQVGHMAKVLNLDLSNFDTSNVINMGWMFYGTGTNANEITLDLSSFNTSKVTNMSGMFHLAGCNSKTLILDLNNFDTSNVIDMSNMFRHTGENSEKLILEISNFNTTNVTNMSGMFKGLGINSVNFSTSILFTIMNRNTVEYENMFYEAAMTNDAIITVNYTTETEALVDQMILTKSENSNVVKGFNVDNLISFDIEGTTYNAYKGMTWAEWVDSEFNIHGFVIIDEMIKKSETSFKEIHTSGDDWVSYNDTVIDDFSYVWGSYIPV